MLKATWIGQLGLFIESDEATIILDPYLSDYIKKVNPAKGRRMPLDETYLNLQPDFLLFTHNHIDHYDPETAPVYLEREQAMTVLAPTSVWNEARKFGGNHNYVQFNRHTVWTEKGVRFTAVKATHSDEFAIGFIIEELSSGDVFYVTGDTLYNKEIFSDLPEKIDAIFLPVNGAGNNMNMIDAAEFAKRTGAKKVVPLHFGMLDDLSPLDFVCENRVIPEIYKEIKIR